nr:ribonuclease P protein component [Paracoccus sp. (in: a-proteobacteria)]
MGSGAAAFAHSAAQNNPVVQIETLRNRPDFLRAAAARRQGTSGFLLQARKRAEHEADHALVRVGYTCSKKIGNAVIRNRAKRRLRALVREILPAIAKPGWDYVLVGRPGATVGRDFADLKKDLTEAVARVHAPRSPKT